MKLKQIIAGVIIVLTPGMVLLRGATKSIGNQEGTKSLEDFGIGQYRIYLGWQRLFCLPVHLP